VNQTIWMITLLFACGVTADTHAEKQVDPRLKEFAKQKRQQTEEMAAKLHLNVPRETRNFFKAAEAGDWVAASNQFARIRPRVGQYEGTTYDPAFTNALWFPLQETYSAYALFALWGQSLLQKYADGILASIPAGSIYFGGTDPGRFAITMVRDVAKSPDIFIITQNGLADSRYTEYLRLTYGKRLWLPAMTNVQAAFQEYVDELKTRQPLPDEQVSVDKDGRVSVRGAGNVMKVGGILAKTIFEENKSQHEFYVEESFPIPWMYPYLEPHGPIMKLNKEPLERLDPTVIEQDREFWAKLSKKLLADPRFRANAEARKMYAKLRSAIGGLYVYRHLTNEAEAAFKQALELGPALREVPFRLAQLYVQMSRYDEAIAVLEPVQNQFSPGPDREKTREAVAQIREMKRKAERKPAE
jgi:tetratricopeptide (TPR) repeat protein